MKINFCFLCTKGYFATFPVSSFFLHHQEVRDKYEKILEEAFAAAKMETRVFNKHWIDSPWSGFFEGKDPLRASPTGIHEDTINHICRRFASAPPNASDFVIHRGLQRILNSK